MASEIVFLITEQRNKQRITLPAGSYRFGRSAQCEYVLRRNNVGEVQFVVACTKDGWTVTDSSTECATWYDNRYLNQGETCPLQEGDVLGLNTDGNASTQEITFRVEEIRTAQSGETGLRQEYISPQVVAGPQEAFYAPKKSLPLRETEGMVCSEFVMCYPPGIPILAPGERITKEILNYIEYAKAKGCSMTGPEDPDILHLNVLA